MAKSSAKSIRSSSSAGTSIWCGDGAAGEDHTHRTFVGLTQIVAAWFKPRNIKGLYDAKSQRSVFLPADLRQPLQGNPNEYSLIRWRSRSGPDKLPCRAGGDRNGADRRH